MVSEFFDAYYPNDHLPVWPLMLAGSCTFMSPSKTIQSFLGILDRSDIKVAAVSDCEGWVRSLCGI